MQKTEYFARLLHLSTAGGIIRLFPALLLVTALSACAGEPGLTLAMADQLQTTAESDLPAVTSLPSGPDDSLAPITNNPPEPLLLEAETATEFTTEIRLEKSARAGSHESLQLVREERLTTSHSNVSFSVQAGYGRIWDDQSMLQKISQGHQETGCAYVAANISF